MDWRVLLSESLFIIIGSMAYGGLLIHSLEESLLFSGPQQILEQILARFILNLRPQTRNIGCVYSISTCGRVS